MGARLLIYLFVLILGGYLGYKDKINIGLSNKLDFIQNISLFFLLFIMGIRIGLDEKVIRSFFSIGFKAGIISISTIIITIIITRIISKFIILKEGENKLEP
ncbi:LysO family transporter [Schnuerera sp.]|uniref:LysO family transporter n=1 Tax=Schnuerera sp. TaxID=2794844 RepID=UPI002BE1F0C6|nr:LysO family transporter [Schnuerera sp.]HSH36871.1 LysO family transporter [Schnuerera sp.]